jgi:plasmid maintenance system antidote protein VapI
MTAVHPGKLIASSMKEVGIDEEDMISLFALHSSKEETLTEKIVSIEKIKSLLACKSRIDKPTAKTLSIILKEGEDFWMQEQAKYDISLVRIEQERRRIMKEQFFAKERNET